jgi:hypothetical protein
MAEEVRVNAGGWEKGGDGNIEYAMEASAGDPETFEEAAYGPNKNI